MVTRERVLFQDSAERESASLQGVGAALVAALGRFLEPALFQVSPRDPAVLLTVVTLVLVVGVAASLVPASRAARVDPLVALRVD